MISPIPGMYDFHDEEISVVCRLCVLLTLPVRRPPVPGMIFTTVGVFTTGRSVYFVGTNVDLTSGEGFHSKYALIFTTMKSVCSIGTSAWFKCWLCQRQNLLFKVYNMVVTTTRSVYSVDRSASFASGRVSYSRYMYSCRCKGALYEKYWFCQQGERL